MSLDADSIVDRRRLRRKLTFWRICAILFVIVALVAIGGYLSSSGESLAERSGAYIARVIQVNALLALGRTREAGDEEGRILEERPPWRTSTRSWESCT